MPSSISRPSGLWTGDAPQAKGTACEDIPTLTILGPRAGTANGSAVVVLPGGAYRGLAADLEGREVADWFTARGFRAFILSYRLTSHGYVLPVPLLDARRAVQLVRARARDYQIDPNRIVIIGFSAGGHLAALAGTQPVPGKPDAEDPIERVSSKPDYMVLGYAWLGAISSDTSHLSYCKLFNLMDQCEALKAAYTPELFVTKDTPPTFMYHTVTDQTVPVQQALGFFNALIKAGVPAELHVFANGPHGSGPGPQRRGAGPMAESAGDLAARAGVAEQGGKRSSGDSLSALSFKRLATICDRVQLQRERKLVRTS